MAKLKTQNDDWDAEDFVGRLLSGEYNGRISETIQALSPERLQQTERILAQRLADKQAGLAHGKTTEPDTDQKNEDDTANVSE